MYGTNCGGVVPYSVTFTPEIVTCKSLIPLNLGHMTLILVTILVTSIVSGTENTQKQAYFEGCGSSKWGMAYAIYLCGRG
jgi:hypothetical protein